jgi:hypothetical protein
MNACETSNALRAALDTLLASAPHQLRLYDHDLSLFDLDHPARHATLRALCVAGGGRRIEILLDHIQHVARDDPRLLHLLRDFGHIIEIRQADPTAPRPDQAFVLADRHGVLLRADKSALNGTLHLDDTHTAMPLLQSFAAMWQRSQARVTATTLGL